MSEEQGEYVVGETLELLSTGFDFERVLERLGPQTTVRYERTIGDDYTCEAWTFEPAVTVEMDADMKAFVQSLRGDGR